MSRGTRDRPLFGRLAGEVAVHRPDGMEMHRFVREPDIGHRSEETTEGSERDRQSSHYLPSLTVVP